MTPPDVSLSRPMNHSYIAADASALVVAFTDRLNGSPAITASDGATNEFTAVTQSCANAVAAKRKVKETNRTLMTRMMISSVSQPGRQVDNRHATGVYRGDINVVSQNDAAAHSSMRRNGAGKRCRVVAFSRLVTGRDNVTTRQRLSSHCM